MLCSSVLIFIEVLVLSNSGEGKNFKNRGPIGTKVVTEVGGLVAELQPPEANRGLEVKPAAAGGKIVSSL